MEHVKETIAAIHSSLVQEHHEDQPNDNGINRSKDSI